MEKKELKNSLLHFVFEHSFKRGTFTLSSGKMSKFYLDMKQTTLDPMGSLLVAENILAMLIKHPVDSIGGLTIGADPIIGSVVTLAAIKNIKVRGFIIRKEPKSHGLHKLIEGKLEKRDKVVIIDDVITTGGSAYKAVKIAEEVGCEVVKIVAIVDRNEGGKEFFIEKGYDYDPIVTIDEVFKYEKVTTESLEQSNWSPSKLALAV